MQTTTSSNHIDTPLKAPRIKGFLLILFLVLLDQGTKYLAILYLKGTSGIPLIDQVLTLRYLENRGMAFGLLQNKILFLVLICMFFFAAIIYLFIKTPATVYYRPLLYTAAVVFSGAMGNFIDRVFRRYVVDFIYFSLIDFPTFNVADIYVTCGIAALVFLLFFRYKEEDDFDFLKPGHKSAK
ncbi:signal peptidase II [Blautia glucerasea]|uniref:signal peptidase II n=1 Tax=Blautia glucerasea TaxID=536633 RepID=UPI001D01927A|nr:signal peptidase II [Blautia glucerasea]MCB5385707.1 signal peptidase II [Blautia glucerasea]MCB5420032.1 signal peptidase II [Blautia luti]